MTDTQAAILKEFTDTLKTRHDLWDADKPARDALQAEWDALLLAEFRKVCKPRERYTYAKAKVMVKNHDELIKPFMAKVKEMGDARAVREKTLEAKLDELAERFEITPDLIIADKAAWTKYDTRTSGDYSTQEFGACKYARESAQNIADHVIACGVPAESRVEKKPSIPGSRFNGGWTIECNQCDVYAACSPEVCEIVRRKPGLTLKEWIRRQWARGINPRVLNPYLPAGLENKLGLDYFGGETKRAVANA